MQHTALNQQSLRLVGVTKLGLGVTSDWVVFGSSSFTAAITLVSVWT